MVFDLPSDGETGHCPGIESCFLVAALTDPRGGMADFESDLGSEVFRNLAHCRDIHHVDPRGKSDKHYCSSFPPHRNIPFVRKMMAASAAVGHTVRRAMGSPRVCSAVLLDLLRSILRPPAVRLRA